MTDQNPFHAPIKSEGAQVPVEQHRAVQEVQAAMIIAKKFPRDQHKAFDRIMTACERSKLAEAASYDYPKGKTMVTGPTIRLAEVMAQNWGNMEFGIRELSQDGNGSEVQAYAWDMETNVRQSKTFIVPHKMKAHGSFKTLSDPRDIYEHVANMGARRLRACILGVIPGDIVDAAVIKCEETLTKGDGKPIEDRVRDMLSRFKDLEISQELIEARLQHKTTAIVRSQLVELGKIYNSIKDGMSKRSDWFDVPKSQQAEAADLTAELEKKAAEKKALEEKDEKQPTAINCPHCTANIKTVIVHMLESGATTFVCPACKEEGKIEDGLPVAIPPVDAESLILCPYCQKELISDDGAVFEGATTFFCPHCNKEGRIEDGKPIGSYPPDDADRNKRDFDTWTDQDWLDWRKEWINLRDAGLSTYFHKNRGAFEAAPIKLKEEGRVRWIKYYPETPWPLAVEVEPPEEQLSPEGEEIAATRAEIHKYPPSREEEAMRNLELPANRPLSLDECNLLLAECQKLTKG